MESRTHPPPDLCAYPKSLPHLSSEGFPPADLNKHVGDVTDAARRSPVFITHHRKPRFVLMAIEEYERLRGREDRRHSFTLGTMPADVEEGLLALADSYDREPDDDH